MLNEAFIIAHTEKGTRLGEKLANRVNGILRAPQRFFAAPGEERGFNGPVSSEIHKLFRTAQVLILIMELETAVRILAPVLTGRKTDPAVLVLDETGKFVINLLSGNKSEIEQLMLLLTDSIGATAVNTINETKQSFPLFDTLACHYKMKIESAELLLKFNEALLNGESLIVWDRWGLKLAWPEHVRVETDTTITFFDGEKLLVVIGHQNVPGVIPVNMQMLSLRPLCLTVGIGCTKNVSTLKVIGAVRRYFREQNWSVKSIKQLVAIDNYTNQTAVSEAGRDLGVSVMLMTANDLLKQGKAINLLTVNEEIEYGMVAENAAMICAPRGKLIGVNRVIDQISIAVVMNQEVTM